MGMGNECPELKQRRWLIEKKRCCGLCPRMLSLRNKDSLFTAEVLCEAAGGDAICPKKACDTYSALAREDLRGINPMLLEYAVQIGMKLPADAIAA